ncbi:TadE/TadG family type IV pilus assembly protein [Sulfitobacter sabulilitoris]|nr:TadE family protein [Sulfitobacter sabulilitoris]
MMRRLPRFWRAEDGAALVEFAMLVPVALVFVAFTFEASRTFWGYQTTITGVRDATRYLSRVVPGDVCDSGGAVSGWNTKLTEIVRDTRSGDTLFPASIRIVGVSATLECVAGDYRKATVPVAAVTATLAIDYPFKGIFRLVGVTLDDVTTVVRDQARVLGT